jgi:hypothetical protein
MDKKNEYWEHLTGECILPKNFTAIRLERIKFHIFQSPKFWHEVLERHGGERYTPAEMKEKDFANYYHCISNMIAMVREYMLSYNVLPK